MHREQASLQKRLFFYSMLGAALISIVVASIAIIPLYNSLIEQEHKNLKFAHKLQRARVEQYFNSLKEIADQMSSRSRIRQELERYNAGEVDLATIQSFNGPKLNDALTHSPEAKGLYQYDKNGERVVSVGIDYPLSENQDLSWKEGTTSISGPFMLDQSLYFLVTAPVRDRQKSVIGKEDVLFSAEGLKKTALKPCCNQSNSHFLFAYRENDSYNWFDFQSGVHLDGSIKDSMDSLLNSLDDKETRISTYQQPILHYEKPIIALGVVCQGANYPILLINDATVIDNKVTQIITKICLLIFGVLVYAGLGLYFLLRPLRNKVLVYQEELKKEVETLQDILPICMHCKNVRDDKGYWDKIEKYISKLSDVELSHGVCDACLKEHYSEYMDRTSDNNN